jgi:hypothetical protein
LSTLTVTKGLRPFSFTFHLLYTGRIHSDRNLIPLCSLRSAMSRTELTPASPYSNIQRLPGAPPRTTDKFLDSATTPDTSYTTALLDKPLP